MGLLVKTGDWGCDSGPGRPTVVDEHNYQYLAVLYGLCPLQGLLPVSCAYSHVSDGGEN